MDCCICPKQAMCSGADCYYDYHPEPDLEMAKDIVCLDQLERRLQLEI